MGTHMKTTVEISDALLTAAKAEARRRGTTLRTLFEEGLRSVLEADPPRDFVLRDRGVDGQGVQEGVVEGDWDRIAAMIYEGHGG